ncbi:MAG: FHA domain-containing protein, partial [Planctomycetes bacterium]|nr:FHA domain-containing protein [Planctomycetota bacterium]
MLTLQILDRGQTSLFPLGDRPVLIGSAAGADLRLTESEVVAEHARLLPTAGGWRLVAQAKVLVNGRAVQQVELTLGDRVEIGQAVLVVGTSVQRPASADDVLAEAVVRRRRGEPARRSKGRIVPVLAGLIALGAIAFFVSQSSDGDRVQTELATIARWQSDGELERADATITRLQQAWRGAEDDRLVRLEA